jgi:hypothetical protein
LAPLASTRFGKADGDKEIRSRLSTYAGAVAATLHFYLSRVLVYGQIGYTVYSKQSGVVANFWIDSQSDQEAMDRALDWMRDSNNLRP